MHANDRIPTHAFVDGEERTLVDRIRHATSDETICTFRDSNGTLRYVSYEEWVRGAELFRAHAAAQGLVTSQSAPAEKISLFRSLFRGREDVYAHGFPRRDGKIGYVPACASEHTRDCPRWTRTARSIKCAECPTRAFTPLTDQTLKAHFLGKDPRFNDVIGMYVLTKDCRTWVLVADFDGAGWERETLLYLQASAEHGLSPSLERSRSGNGAHVWLFFEEAIDATLARNLGSTLISWAMSHSIGMSFSAYDRLFPTQNTLSEDGLGNLIALPFQGQAMRAGNSVFVNEQFEPYPDQWRYLSSVKRVPTQRVREIVDSASEGPLGILATTSCSREQGGTEPLATASGKRLGNSSIPTNSPITTRTTKTSNEPLSRNANLSSADFPDTVEITRSNAIYVKKEGMSATAQNRIRRLAAFGNPEFYRAQAMHQSVYKKQRIIWCGEETADYIVLPRGCEPKLLTLLGDAGVPYHISDQRNTGEPLTIEFAGHLRSSQQEAVDALLHHENGVLSAPTGFGKTVVGAALICALGMRTLVLVPRSVLVRQWVERLNQFLVVNDSRPPLLTKSGKPSKRKRPVIGQIGGGKNKPSGLVDVATFQSLISTDDISQPCVKSLVGEYDLVICDECHHGAAPNLERVMKSVKARRVYGFSATPKRADGLESIVFMQCGPIRHTVSPKEQALEQGFERVLVPRFTHVRLPRLEPGASFNEVVNELCAHPARNKLIAADVTSAMSQGRTPLVLTRRKSHASQLAAAIEGLGHRTFVLTGDGSAREQRERMESIFSAENSPYAIVATGSFAGEGFDLPRLDTLMLASPYSWEGVVTQFVGRLHREDSRKREVIVYDYVDTSVPMLERMYKRRLKAYARLGYRTTCADDDSAVTDGAQLVDGGAWLEALGADINGAQRNIAILAPYASAKVADMLSATLKQAIERGVPVSVSISEPASDSALERLRDVAATLRDVGCEASIAKLNNSGIAIVDERIVWYGTLPLLALPKEDDCSLRIVNAEVAADVARMIRESKDRNTAGSMHGTAGNA